MKKVIGEMSDLDFEMLLVDDGSSDGTLSVIKAYARQNSMIKYISFSRNFGKEAAIYAELKNATGDYVVVMDVDLQDRSSSAAPGNVCACGRRGIRFRGYKEGHQEGRIENTLFFC